MHLGCVVDVRFREIGKVELAPGGGRPLARTWGGGWKRRGRGAREEQATQGECATCQRRSSLVPCQGSASPMWQPGILQWLPSRRRTNWETMFGTDRTTLRRPSRKVNIGGEQSHYVQCKSRRARPPEDLWVTSTSDRQYSPLTRHT